MNKRKRDIRDSHDTAVGPLSSLAEETGSAAQPSRLPQSGMGGRRPSDTPRASRPVLLLGWTALLVVVISGWLPQAARGIERFPPPDFTAHEMPDTPTPSPSAGAWEYLDVAVLLGALIVASYLGLVSRSRNALFALAVFSLLWFGFWRKGCVCSIGSIQNVTQGFFDPSYAVPLGVIAFFSLPLVFTLLFGRTFCAAVCPLGAIQEVVAVRPQRLPGWVDHALGLFPWVYLGLAVVYAATGTAYVICEYDPFVAFFRRSGSLAMLVFGGAMLVIGVFVGRPYCRFLCPYGAVLGLLSKVSRRHVRIPPEECIRCRLCEDACPYEAILPPSDELNPNERARGRRRLALCLALFPVWLALGAGIGYLAHPAVAWLDADVRLAAIVASDSVDPDDKFANDALEAFANTGEPKDALFARVQARRETFAWASTLLGVWVGLVIGAKLVQLSLRRRRDEYQPDPRRCVACGRCFWYCPEEQVRRGWISREQIQHLETPAPATATAGE